MLNSCEWFDAEWYLKQYLDVTASSMTADYHYLHYGIKQNKKPNPYVKDNFLPSLEDRLSLLKNSEWFDAQWYLQQYPDVAKAGVDAAHHYLHHGIAEGRSPSPTFLNNKLSLLSSLLVLLNSSEWFDKEWYLQQYPDVAEAGIDPAYHYLHFGATEGRRPGPRFDEGYYLSQLSKPLTYDSGLLHFLLEGEKSGLKPVREWNCAPWWWQLFLPSQSPLSIQILESLNKQPLPIVIVPVFNAAEALADCLASLKEHSQGVAKVIVIDDASTDPAITELLNFYKKDSFFQCYRNEHNLGFSGTVNRGICLALRADVILLNSDTKVTRGFAHHLRLAAYSRTKVATVTPLSNNAGVFSVPLPGNNQVPAHIGLSRFALAISQAAVSEAISVPTGHGFCMFIRRQAIDETGLFDAEAFPRGYGEENDFCRRSAALGWQHLIDPRTYIFHQGSASFATEKQTLIASGLAILEQRYPDYSSQVRKSFGGDNIGQLRHQIAKLTALSIKSVEQIRPRVLYVISSLMGGTPHTNQDLMHALTSYFECFVLHCDSKTLTLRHFSDGVYTNIAEYQLSVPLQALPHTNEEYDQVIASWLAQWSIDLVHVRHLAWHSLGLISAARTLGIPLIHSFHDFYTLCPSVKLLDNNFQYCAAMCTQGSGKCLHELWPADAFYDLKHNQIHTWQKLFSKALSSCDAFVTTNQSTKNLILSRYPELSKKPFEVIPHGRDFSHFESLAVKPENGETLRLICPGNIGDAKGLRLIEKLALRRKDVEIHILGIVTCDLALPENVKVHGPYIREQLSKRVAQIKPHCGAIFSIWPETWCHTLTEMWAAGIPVIGVDIGAVGERLKQTQAGWLFNGSIEVLEEIIEMVRQSAEWEGKVQSVMHWQSHQGKTQTCQTMANSYIHIYKSLIGHI